MKTLRTTFLAICLSLVTASEYSCIGEYMRHTRKGSGISSSAA